MGHQCTHLSLSLSLSLSQGQGINTSLHLYVYEMGLQNVNRLSSPLKSRDADCMDLVTHYNANNVHVGIRFPADKQNR